MHPFHRCADYRSVLPLAVAMAMVVAPVSSVDEPDQPPAADVEAPSETDVPGDHPIAESAPSPNHRREVFAAFTTLASLSYAGLWLDLLIRKRRLALDTISSERYVFEDCIVECLGPEPGLSSPIKIRLAALGGTPLLLTALSTTSSIGMGIALSRIRPQRHPTIAQNTGLILIAAGSATWLVARYVPLGHHCWMSDPTCLERRLTPTLVMYGLGAGMLATGAGMLAYGRRAHVQPTVAVTRGHAQVGVNLRF